MTGAHDPLFHIHSGAEAADRRLSVTERTVCVDNDKCSSVVSYNMGVNDKLTF